MLSPSSRLAAAAFAPAGPAAETPSAIVVFKNLLRPGFFVMIYLRLLRSKHVLQCKLNLPLIDLCRGHATKRACSQAGSRVVELCCVEHIKKLRPKQQLVSF